MPALQTHLAIAQTIGKELTPFKEQFYLGNLLPDLTKERNHKKFHFSENKIPNIEKFLSNFKTALTPIELGYLCHLLTDKFYNEFIFKKYIEFDHNELVSIKMNGKKQFKSEKTINQIKHSVYENYDRYLLKNNRVKSFSNLTFLEKCPMPTIEGITFDQSYVKKVLENLNYEINHTNYAEEVDFAFSNQTELDKILNQCCQYILNFLKENSIKVQNKKIIGIDFDGTIADYYGYQSKFLLEQYGLKIKNSKATSFQERFGIDQESIGYSEENYFDLYFANVPTKPNVAKTIHKLKKEGFLIYIITNRSNLRRKYLEDYFKKHGIEYDQLFCLNRRNKVSKLDQLIKLHVELMIEDHPYQVESISKEIKVICVDDDYNRTIKGKNIFHIKDWMEVVEIIKKEL